MGIYTNFSGYSSSSNYTDVQPFVGENFNYHELGILAAAEISANQNAFMKNIALSELAAYEQTGSTDVMYESVNFSGIIEKVKAFFKKIIEKIHKIFHTFIAKLQSWFGGNADFARKYEKEVIKNWADVKNDWTFKGYNFKHLHFTKDAASTFKSKSDVVKGSVKEALDKLSTSSDELAILAIIEKISKKVCDELITEKENLNSIRDKMDDIRDSMRAIVCNTFVEYTGNSLDSSEFTEELFKGYRSGENSKDDIEKKDLLGQYGGSINGMMAYIKEFDKIKKDTEKAEHNITSSIDKIIKAFDKVNNDIIKDNNNTPKGTTEDEQKKATDKVKSNETMVQFISVMQGILGNISEYNTQAFSALLQAQKDACVQAKEIAVKVVGLNKKMTESYDYSDNESTNEFDFISSVKLV